MRMSPGSRKAPEGTNAWKGVALESLLGDAKM